MPAQEGDVQRAPLPSSRKVTISIAVSNDRCNSNYAY
jgi:hypothetical protein